MTGVVRASLVLAALTVLFTGACSTNQPDASTAPAPVSQSPAALKIQGTVTVEAGIASDGDLGGECVTDGGYSDIRSGAQVTVKDATGVVVALGALDPGKTVDNRESVIAEGEFVATKCVFGFTVSDAPEGGQFYSVEVSHRGELRYTRSDLDKTLNLTLGS